MKKLPLGIVNAINSVPWMEKVRSIAKTNNLDKNQEELFVTETTIVVFGIESPTKYPINLAENVGLSDDIVIKISKEVDEQIITPIMKAVTEKVSVTTTPPANLPMVEKGEVAHDVAPATSEVGSKKQEVSSKPEQAKVSLPDYRYPGGQDPYREPTK